MTVRRGRHGWDGDLSTDARTGVEGFSNFGKGTHSFHDFLALRLSTPTIIALSGATSSCVDGSFCRDTPLLLACVAFYQPRLILLVGRSDSE